MIIIHCSFQENMAVNPEVKALFKIIYDTKCIHSIMI